MFGTRLTSFVCETQRTSAVRSHTVHLRTCLMEDDYTKELRATCRNESIVPNPSSHLLPPPSWPQYFCVNYVLLGIVMAVLPIFNTNFRGFMIVSDPRCAVFLLAIYRHFDLALFSFADFSRPRPCSLKKTFVPRPCVEFISRCYVFGQKDDLTHWHSEDWPGLRYLVISDAR